MTLHGDAEAIADQAREIYGGCKCYGCERDKGCDFAPMVADLVEREARAFAERALAHYARLWGLGETGKADAVEKYAEWYDLSIAAAIAAAEGDAE
jgi:hypothetical protein